MVLMDFSEIVRFERKLRSNWLTYIVVIKKKRIFIFDYLVLF